MALLGLKLHLWNLQHAADIQRRRSEMCTLRNLYKTPLDHLLDREFLATYKLPKYRAAQLIRELEALIPPAPGDISAERKIFITLNCMATGSDQRTIGQSAMHGVSQASVSRAVTQVVTAFNHETILNKYIKFPSNQQERDIIKDRFYELFGIPGVLGAIDCSHVRLIKPSENEDAFLNRKHFHSLNMQVICDADAKIISVDASYGGSNHDNVIFEAHPVHRHLKSLRENGENVYLLGDSGYAQRDIVMTPVLHPPHGSDEAHYNDMHVRARNVIERCFGVLKARWRCTSSVRALLYEPRMAAKMINACAVLHNIGRKIKLDSSPLDVDFLQRERRLADELNALQDWPDLIENARNEDLQRGRAIRAALVQQLARQ